MYKIDEKKIQEILSSFYVPDTDVSFADKDVLKSLQISDAGDVSVMLQIKAEQAGVIEPLRAQAEQSIKNIKGVRSALVILTAEKQVNQSKVSVNDPHGMEKNPVLDLPVKRIIAVASGKGGVGKSTMAAGIARTLSLMGEKTGLLDADIYGPSVPTLMGIDGQKPDLNDDKKLVPIDAYGVKTMSIGYMVDNEAPMIWRGPMVQTAIYQMLRDVNWDGVDTLIVDMPPGTGDAQLTLAQKVPLTGAIIVSTPQDLALIDARKAIKMFEKVNVPILGLIENMSTHICTNCGHEEHIFDHGGAKEEAEKNNIMFLGEVPLSVTVRTGFSEEVYSPIVEKIKTVS